MTKKKPSAAMNEKTALLQMETFALSKDITAASVCDAYQQVRPAVSALLFLVKMIPGWGKKAAMIITILVEAADEAC